ncbi:hypothetical protein [Streptomyces sp. ML-6]|uniref:hypothetical protein n=1 Tax=Streptomyces sp. ML-6 TaxID=2982693 RepID=UPI0024BF1359|nr:hypothetical protein [Streptomyces sp. ML-6]MDK0517502.1 hypothetical protein [Streptomyces sp. ML-6]MDK0524012.1 hypothetical protein [Streptomyces sp. ML-6]MDK0524786.1 hypothetical protein [Streptomyces sp. ML-6]MDK0524892.1 hypothetical protein [Streptomyces sp. ML-6]
MADPVLAAEDGGDIELLVRARRRLRDLVVQLEVAPFADRTARSMRAYLDEDAAPAQAAFARWAALPKAARDTLAARMRQEQP